MRLIVPLSTRGLIVTAGAMTACLMILPTIMIGRYIGCSA